MACCGPSGHPPLPLPCVLAPSEWAYIPGPASQETLFDLDTYRCQSKHHNLIAFQARRGAIWVGPLTPLCQTTRPWYAISCCWASPRHSQTPPSSCLRPSVPALQAEVGLLLRVLKGAAATNAHSLELKLTIRAVPSAAGGSQNKPFLCFTAVVRSQCQ
jgi:hypothetical protein